MLKTFAAAALALLPLTAAAETHEVRMLNRGALGAMVYEPDYLALTPGDTVRFIAASPGHNAASVEGLWPQDAAPVLGQINEEIEVIFEVPGTYGIKCSPHFAMGMAMLIRVGEGTPEAADLPAGLPSRAEARFREILARLPQGE